ncbi:unnamed protein product [Closterium sp. NIES-53]
MLRPRFVFTIRKSAQAVLAASGSSAPKPALLRYPTQPLFIPSHLSSLELPSQPSHFLSQRHAASTDPSFETSRHAYAVDRATDGFPCAATAATVPAATPPSADATPASDHSRRFTRRAERRRHLAASDAAAAEPVTPSAALLETAHPLLAAAAAAASEAGETMRAAGVAGDAKWQREPWSEVDVQGVKPDTYVYSSLFGLLGRAREAANLKGLLEEMGEDGCEHNAFTLKALAAAYACAGRFEQALATLAEMKHRGFQDDVVTIGAKTTFKEMISRRMLPDVRCANSLMHMYGAAGRIDDAMAVFDRMCLAAVAAGAGQGREGGGELEQAPDLISYTLAVSLLSEAGRLCEAEATFEAMLVAGMQPDAVAWATMLLMWAGESNSERAAMWFERMVVVGCRPNASAYNALLLAFVSAGMFDEAEEVLSAFKYGWDLVGQVRVVGKDHSGSDECTLAQPTLPALPWVSGDSNSLWSGQTLNRTGGKVPNWLASEPPNLMTYVMLLNVCIVSTAGNTVGRLMRLLEATEHPAHTVLQLLMESLEPSRALSHLFVEECGSEGGSEYSSWGVGGGEVARDREEDEREC